MAGAGEPPAAARAGPVEPPTVPVPDPGGDSPPSTSRRRLRRARSPFVRFLAQRLALLPVQLLFVLVILFVFGTVLPAVWLHESACTLAGEACTCPWSNVVCSTGPFFSALTTFVDHIVTGKWGETSYFGIVEPTARYFTWWLPNSIELAVVALGIAGSTAYFVGIRAGWRPGGAVDAGARTLASVGLLLPAFFLIFFLLISSWTPYLQYMGDTPYGTLPGALWLDLHGGRPGWVGIAGTTSPTGFPIVDALWHGDIPYAVNVLVRTLLQGGIIAIAYLAIFFRYARHAVGEALREPYILAARARGVPDRTLLWHHAGRRVLPIYALVFAATLPAYIVTQAIAEAVYNYNGIGTLVMYNFSVGGANVAGFDQVAIFLLAAVVMGSTLVADLLSRALDPRFRR
ncbi:MAG: ABC transporter permease [Thermoplasmata archaeon]